ncbi:MAG TPA: peptidylprolyl isomerase [Candidatus Sulfomarinibacteraceae bacterium]|nr:peptidylprolyl isomerase [Candidatus Sulfomarinibacteraceae bacterium]
MANETDIQVQDDIVVGLDYVLRLDDGEVVDSSQGRDPLEFIQGRGQIITGLEQELYGMGVGDEKSVRVEAGEAYGEYDDERLQNVPRDAFPDDMELEEGMSVRMRDSNSGNLFDAYIDEVGEDSVVLDFNHPLAGETLHFDVKISSLRQASDEELDHGHVHAA